MCGLINSRVVAQIGLKCSKAYHFKFSYKVPLVLLFVQCMWIIFFLTKNDIKAIEVVKNYLEKKFVINDLGKPKYLI